MFFSWWFLLFLASHGFSGAQSNHVAREYGGNENAAEESYGARSLAERDAADYGYDRMDDDLDFENYEDNSIDRYKNKELEKKKLALGFATFIMGGISAVLRILPTGRVGQRRSEDEVSRKEDLRKKIKKNIQLAQSSLLDLEKQVTGKSKRYLQYN